MARYCKLILISELNNNKYYEMTETSSEIQVKYGRVDVTCTQISKPLHQWDKIRNEKIKKGYVDVSELFETNEGEVEIEEIQNKKINEFINLMFNYTKNLVNKTYSSKKVTEKQIEKAQEIISDLNLNISKYDGITINSKLIELYTVIPRVMSKVNDHLLPKIDKFSVIELEQDNLDALKANLTISSAKVSEKNTINLLDTLNIEMDEVTDIPEELVYLTKQISKPYQILKIRKSSEEVILQNHISNAKNKTTKFLIHGTRCSSVIPIIKTGLQIRPSGNFQFSGKVYGNGNYFSETINKSLNYTGYDNDQILFVYEVHVGNPFVYQGWYNGNSFTLNLKELSSRGFDSTYVSAGNGLLNSEIITYTENQQSLRYILWLKR